MHDGHPFLFQDSLDVGSQSLDFGKPFLPTLVRPAINFKQNRLLVRSPLVVDAVIDQAVRVYLSNGAIGKRYPDLQPLVVVVVDHEPARDLSLLTSKQLAGYQGVIEGDEMIP